MIHKTGRNNNFGSMLKYMLQEKDHNGDKRESVNVIKGDIELTREFAKNFNNENNAVHSILRFTPNENKTLTEKEKHQILESFIEQQAKGLPSADRLMCVVVEHDKNKPSAHYHIATVKGDLETGKTYQPWVTKRGDEHRFNAWNHVMSDAFNLNHPDEQPRPCGNSGKSNNQSKEQKKDKGYFEKELTDLASRGVIKNREDMIEFLKENYKAEVTRKSKDSLSFKLPNSKRAMRFKGHIFSSSFTNTSTIKTYIEQRKQRPAPKISLAKLNILEAKVKAYNAGRYETDNSNAKGKESALLSKFDLLVNSALRNNNKTEPLQNSIDKVDWKEAIEAAKSYNAQAVHTDNELIKVAAFVEKHSEFIENYDDYNEHKHDDKALDENGLYIASDEDIATDNGWIEMYNSVKEARINIVQQETKTETKTETKPKPRPQQQESGGRGSGDISSAVDSIIKKLISDMQQIHNERDNTLKQQSSGYANEAKKANAPAPRPSSSKPKGKSKGKKKKGKK